jgi:hypothetical protein
VTRTPDLRPHYIFRGSVLHHFASNGETPQPVAVVGGFAPRLNLSVRATAPANVKLERHALQYADVCSAMLYRKDLVFGTVYETRGLLV